MFLLMIPDFSCNGFNNFNVWPHYFPVLVILCHENSSGIRHFCTCKVFHKIFLHTAIMSSCATILHSYCLYVQVQK